MYDFNDIQGPTQSQRVRAFAIEKGVELLGSGSGHSGADLLNVAEMVYGYIMDGDTEGTITAAVREGYTVLSVKELVEGLDVFDNMGNVTHLDLNALFISQGWDPNVLVTEIHDSGDEERV